MLEIRGHARGGQGMVTAFEILAKAFSQMDDFQVQAFPAFGVERTGAPIQAFLRIAKKEILNRSNIYNPDLIVIFDESLIDQIPVFDGLNQRGAALINSEKPLQYFKGFASKVFTIPATSISLDLGLGSKSLPIVNAAMIGAVLRIFNADLALGKDIIRENVPVKHEANVQSLAQAFNRVVGYDKPNGFLMDKLHELQTDVQGHLEALSFEEMPQPEGLPAPFWSVPMSQNKTGNWRLMTPGYVDRLPPCNASCPAGTDVRAFVRQVSENKFQEAYETITVCNPFPSICGRVCPNFCEQNCNRNSFDQGLNVGAIERFVGDKALNLDVEELPFKYDKRIAVIGSGPAGLTTALRLREKGYPVTVFEAMSLPGGMMRSGIPTFRLPDQVLDREIEIIKKKGVEIVLNRKVTIEELSEDFDAVVTAVGSHIGSGLRLDNESLARDGIEFLRKFKFDGDKRGIKPGDKVAIIGGGNTAVDVARTALRLAAEPTIYYRRTIKEMPAIAQEVEEAQAEGVEFQFLAAPVGLSGSNGRIKLDLVRMQLGEADESGRRRPLPVEGSLWSIEVDHVITATGQTFDGFAFGEKDIVPKQGKIEYKGNTPVFCAGDMAWGGSVAEAIGSGNKAAAEVDAYLREIPYDPQVTPKDIVLPEDINYAYFLPVPRHRNKMYHSEDLHNDFTEVVKELKEDEVIAESARCLHCGDCFSCGNCFNYCPDAAIHVDEQGRVRIDYDFCKGCGICVEECPCSAIEFSLNKPAEV